MYLVVDLLDHKDDRLCVLDIYPIDAYHALGEGMSRTNKYQKAIEKKFPVLLGFDHLTSTAWFDDKEAEGLLVSLEEFING